MKHIDGGHQRWSHNKLFFKKLTFNLQQAYIHDIFFSNHTYFKNLTKCKDSLQQSFYTKTCVFKKLEIPSVTW